MARTVAPYLAERGLRAAKATPAELLRVQAYLRFKLSDVKPGGCGISETVLKSVLKQVLELNMNIVPAQEIKRRGIAAVDEALAQGPVHIIKNNRAQYVVLTEARYQELLEMQEEAVLARVKASLEDAKAGRTTRHRSVEALLKHLDKSAE